MAIAKKHLRRATSRNRIKRLIRESFRQHQSLLQGLDLVVLARPGLDQVDNRTLLQSLERHWQRAARSTGD